MSWMLSRERYLGIWCFQSPVTHTVLGTTRLLWCSWQLTLTPSSKVKISLLYPIICLSGVWMGSLSSHAGLKVDFKFCSGKMWTLCSSPSEAHLSSVAFNCSVTYDSLWPRGLQHARPPCPSPTPGVYPNSCPLSQWCHPTISSSVIPFSSCTLSFTASGSFLMSQLFTSGGQSVGVSASKSALPMNTQDWSPLGWTGWISLQSKGLSRAFSNTTVQKHQLFGTQLFL